MVVQHGYYQGRVLVGTVVLAVDMYSALQLYIPIDRVSRYRTRIAEKVIQKFNIPGSSVGDIAGQDIESIISMPITLKRIDTILNQDLHYVFLAAPKMTWRGT